MSRKLRLTLIILAAAVLAVGGFIVYKTVVPPARSAWIQDLQYSDSEVQPLKFSGGGDRSCPMIPLTVDDKAYDMMFDTGCGPGIFFSDLMKDKLSYTSLGTTEELNRDGSHRGWSERVCVEAFTVGGSDYKNVETTISDWTLYSSSPFNGSIGLEYFADKVVTLDYAKARYAVSGRPVDYDRLPADCIVLPLFRSTAKGQESLPFFEAQLGGEPVMVYLDTGKNYSYIDDPDTDYTITGKPGDFQDVTLTVGDADLMLRDVAAANDMAQAQGLPYPTRIELNSDQIWKNNIVVTFDLISQKMILFLQQQH